MKLPEDVYNIISIIEQTCYIMYDICRNSVCISICGPCLHSTTTSIIAITMVASRRRHRPGPVAFGWAWIGSVTRFHGEFVIYKVGFKDV